MTFFLTRIDSLGCWPCTGCGLSPEGGASETWSTSPCCCAFPTALCPFPTDAESVGDGGGLGDPDLVGVAASLSSDGVTGSGVGLPFLPFELAEDLFDSARSRFPPSFAEIEFLGLSDLAPGIFDRSPRKEREDSLVSDLPKEGYDWSPSPPDLSSDVDEALLGVPVPFEGC